MMTLLFVILLAARAVADGGGTTFWINQEPLASQYQAMQSCAIGPVSTIIRGMKSGCGVKGTSYTSSSCFCSSSKSQLQYTMGVDIMNACSTDSEGEMTASQQVTSAMELYNSYCNLPIIMAASAAATATPPASTLVTSATSSSASIAATPGGSLGAAGAVNTAPAQTSSPATPARPSSLDSGAIVGIVIGVIAFVVILALLIAIMFFVRRKRASEEQMPGNMREKTSLDVVPMFLDRRSEPRARPSTSCRTEGISGGRKQSQPTNSSTERRRSSTLNSQHAQTDTNSPVELVSPSSPAGGLMRSDTGLTGSTMVQTHPLPARPGERRLTPMAELEHGPNRVELEANMPPVRPHELIMDNKALPRTPGS